MQEKLQLIILLRKENQQEFSEEPQLIYEKYNMI